MITTVNTVEEFILFEPARLMAAFVIAAIERTFFAICATRKKLSQGNVNLAFEEMPNENRNETKKFSDQSQENTN